MASDLHLVSKRLNETLSGFVVNPEQAVKRSEKEKRNTPRIESRIKVTVDIEQEGQQINAVTQDISMGGMNLKCNQHLQRGSQLAFMIHLPTQEPEKKEEVFKLTGRIVHEEKRKKSYYYGIQFDSLNRKQDSSLKRVFSFFGKQHSYA